MTKLCILSGFLCVLLSMTAEGQNANLAMYKATDQTTYYLSTNKNYYVPFFIKDMGPSFSSKVKYAYSINNGPIVKESTIVDHNDASNCVNGVGYSGYRVTLKSPVFCSSPGLYTLKIWIDSIDGFSDINHSNDTLWRNFKAMNNVPVRKGLNEYAYHVSCGPCGEHGTAFNEFLMANYDDYMVSVKLHAYAPGGAWGIFNCPEAREIDSTIDGITHPQMSFNRVDLGPYDSGLTYYPYPGFCPTDSNFVIRDVEFANKVPCDLTISNYNLNNATNILSCQMNAKFWDAMSFSQEMRLSCMLVEDSIYYYQASNGTHPVDSEYHRFVLRKVYGGPWGKAGSMPSVVSAGQTVMMSISDTLSTVYNKSRLYLIPILQAYTAASDTREILNVRRYRMNQLTVPAALDDLNKQGGFNIYPNPTQDMATLTSTTSEKFKEYHVYTIDGKLLQTSKFIESTSCQISLQAFPEAIYILRVQGQSGQWFTLRLQKGH